MLKERSGKKRTPGHEAVLEKLRLAGVDESVLRGVEDNFIPKAEYTRQRQADTESMRQLREQVAYLGGMVQGGGGAGGKKSATAAFLEELEQDPNGAVVKPLFERMISAVRSDMQAETGTALSAVQRETRGLVAETQLRDYLESVMVPMFGEGVREVWPEVKAQASQMLARGEKAYPENILFDLFPEEALELRSEAAAEMTKQKQEAHLEGTVRVRRSEPTLSGHGGREADGTQNKAPERDYDADAADILRAIGAKA